MGVELLTQSRGRLTLFTFSQLLLNGLAEWESLNEQSGKIQMAYLLLTSPPPSLSVWYMKYAFNF